MKDREEAYRKVQQIKHLRNNIAHFEPIIFVSKTPGKARELYRDYKVIMKMVRWLDPDTMSWTEIRSSAHFFEVWNTCPSFFKSLALSVPDGEQKSNSDKWQWFTPDGQVKK